MSTNIYEPYFPLNNKYYKWYMNICISRKYRPQENGFIEHHIVPDCFFIESKRGAKDGWLEGDSDEPSNLVFFTEKEHFIVHWLLCKSYTGLAKRKMIHAFKFMCERNKIKSAKYYAYARQLFIEGNKGKDNPRWKETTEKICPICKINFHVKPSGENRIFCSYVCKFEFQKINFYGENNHFFGKHHTQETLQILHDKQSGKIAWNKGLEGNKGETNPSSKLTENQVKEIKDLYHNHIPIDDKRIDQIQRNGKLFPYERAFCLFYGQQFNVSHKTIDLIITEKKWKYLNNQNLCWLSK